LVSKLYEYNTILTTIFLKTYGEDTLQCLYKEYISLDRWQVNKDLLYVFNFYNLFFVTTHQYQGKKVSLLSPGDVNLGPVPSRWGCLRTVPIM
jgi:hypothetical protein